MDTFGYDILALIGEGSFGRVYKARRRQNNDIVALKLITKCGRSCSDIQCLRQECDIQKDLNHANIIRMVDSFETESEIVVVTEFAKKDLHQILSEDSYLSEGTACKIICDLVSALYYLHSNRVLHRDLKPQNVLISSSGTAKVCDFGFARHMGLSTHVLTSIKGTPLYMAPELMAGNPYDHNADIWSMGCIAYEMMTGSPPFITKSILHLVQMIRAEEIRWPEFVSAQCLDFLRGVLHKEATSRLSWPRLLHHPFLSHPLNITTNPSGGAPLTAELTSSQALAKERQIISCAANTKDACGEGGVEKQMHGAHQQAHLDSFDRLVRWKERVGWKEGRSEEAEEWLAFLSTTREEVVAGEADVAQPAMVAMLARALACPAPTVLAHAATLFSLPFVCLPQPSTNHLNNIRTVYCEAGLVGRMVCCLERVVAGGQGEVGVDVLEGASACCALLACLCHGPPPAATLLVEALTTVPVAPVLVVLLAARRRKPSLAADILALLTLALRTDPSATSPLVTSLFLSFPNPSTEVSGMLRHSCDVLRRRLLSLLKAMEATCVDLVRVCWSPTVLSDLHALIYDSDHTLRLMAEDFLTHLKQNNFFKNEESESNFTL